MSGVLEAEGCGGTQLTNGKEPKKFELHGIASWSKSG